MQYLMIASKEQIEDTCFFVCNATTIDESITRKLGHAVIMPLTPNVLKKPYLYHFLFRILYWWVPKSKIYAQDHSFITSLLIDKAQYILLEDAPFFMTMWQQLGVVPSQPPTGRIKYVIPKSWKYGYIYGAVGGVNKQCICRLITEKIDKKSIFAKDGYFEIVDMRRLWKEADEWKQEYICNLFGLNLEELREIKAIPNILLTQPLMTDANCTSQDVFDVYSPIIKQYESSGICVKPHPRDTFPYEDLFSNVKILRNKLPIQILVYMGYTPLRAITIASSAISAFSSKETEIVWLGTSIHPKIFQAWGDLKQPIAL